MESQLQIRQAEADNLKKQIRDLREQLENQDTEEDKVNYKKEVEFARKERDMKQVMVDQIKERA